MWRSCLHCGIIFILLFSRESFAFYILAPHSTLRLCTMEFAALIFFLVHFCYCCCTLSNASKPKLSELQKNVDSIENRTFSSSCNLISGSLPIRFEWYKDERLLENSVDQRIKIDHFDDFSSHLTIRRLQQSDSGVYACKAFNQFGASDQTSTHLLIKGAKNESAQSLNLCLNVALKYGQPILFFVSHK